MKRQRPDPVRMCLEQPEWLTSFANLRAVTHELSVNADRLGVVVERAERLRRRQPEG